MYCRVAMHQSPVVPALSQLVDSQDVRKCSFDELQELYPSVIGPHDDHKLANVIMLGGNMPDDTHAKLSGEAKRGGSGLLTMCGVKARVGTSNDITKQLDMAGDTLGEAHAGASHVDMAPGTHQALRGISSLSGPTMHGALFHSWRRSRKQQS